MMMVTMMCGMMLRVGCVCVRCNMRYLLKYVRGVGAILKLYKETSRENAFASRPPVLPRLHYLFCA